ncbi:GNAT family N-acetyltransferase [Rubellimicrobium sp. CFH 75288]|uniref:GNAT family N-acetyltransferase n=1 Tax=Rubellimicrobium sp. CFH 75288 TaxID=2697034 RepID=UPI0014124657|nr:GNAT family N-acyltransferase [Rubellimicrobium sp. CFH 75288]NAZ36806.1 GNAT family N-acetyltransferase [Rubellimicrobium sp. CFH 75288]
MSRELPRYSVRMAATETDLRAAQALRYRIFVEEMGVRGGALTDPVRRLERDRYDPFCRHLLLFDSLSGPEPVATLRILTAEGAAEAGRFGTEDEFDIAPLRRSGQRLLEVGRTCLCPGHRGGAAMHRLWQALGAFVDADGADLLIGLASFHGRDPEAVAQPLTCLARHHLSPAGLRPRSLRPIAMDRIGRRPLDRRAAVLGMPPLLKAYLRLGATVGEGACLDDDFACLDVCVVLRARGIGARARAIYAPSCARR